MAWLTRETEVLATLELPHRGWQRELSGAVLLRGTPAVQTLRPAMPLDLAWCREVGPPPALAVVRLTALRPRRVVLARPRAPVLLAAGPGAFERWGLRVGDRLEIKGD